MIQNITSIRCLHNHTKYEPTAKPTRHLKERVEKVIEELVDEEIVFAYIKNQYCEESITLVSYKSHQMKFIDLVI